MAEAAEQPMLNPRPDASARRNPVYWRAVWAQPSISRAAQTIDGALRVEDVAAGGYVADRAASAVRAAICRQIPGARDSTSIASQGNTRSPVAFLRSRGAKLA